MNEDGIYNSKNKSKGNSQHEDKDNTKWIGYSDMNKPFYNLLMGTFSLGATLVTHPLTGLSVRQQAGQQITGDAHLAGNVVTHMRDAYRSVGFRGLFRGYVPMATVGAPSNMIYFDLMEKTREEFQETFTRLLPNAPEFAVDIVQVICSSCIATFVSLIPFVPGEVLSSRLIVQQGRVALNSIQMSKEIYREQSVGGFFRGFNSSFLVGMIGGAQWWYSYGACRKFGMNTRLGEENQLLVEGAAGLVAGVSSTVVAHPLDTIKTRIMTSSLKTTPHSFVSLLIQVVRSESHRALFRGMPAAIYQAALGSTIFAFLYETIKNISQNPNNEP